MARRRPSWLVVGGSRERGDVGIIQEGIVSVRQGRPYLRLLGGASCGRARGAPKPGQPLLTSATWIRSSPRRRTRGSGYPAARKDAPESHTRSRSPDPPPTSGHARNWSREWWSGPKDSSHTSRTKPHPRACTLTVTPRGATLLNLSLPHPQSDLVVVAILFRPKLVPVTHAHHIPLGLQTRQLGTPRAQVRGGRVSVARAGASWAGSPRFFRL